jgi:hypothetical protein
MDLITFVSFFLFGLYLAGRLYFKKVRALSGVPWWVGDPAHFGVGAFITRLPVEWAWLVATLYVIYQLFDWRINQSDAAKDMAAFLAGVLVGMGYDVVKF